MARKGSTRPAGAAKSKGKVRVDLSGVETRTVLPEGEHLVKVEEVTVEDGRQAQYLKWKFKPVEGSGTLFYNTSLSEQALWNLRSLLEALQIEIPDSAFDLDLEDYVDREVMVNVEHETYEGKKQAKVVDFWPAGEESESGDDADEEEEEKPAKKGKAAKEEPEEEEEKPAKKGKADKGKKAAPKKVSQDEVNDMDQDELEALIEEHELEVDLSEFKTIRKMRGAVVDALEEKDLLEE